LQGLPDLCLCPSCTAPSASNVTNARNCCVGDSIVNSRRHSLCTWHTFQISSTTSKLSCVARTTTVPLPFPLTVLPFQKVALAIMWLAPLFEEISHYIPYITFRFNFENVRR
jgi:hypothetical protein